MENPEEVLMQRINTLLTWFRPAPKVEAEPLQRLEGIKVHFPEESVPKVKVFAARPQRSAEAA
jgi:hypothetical protein